MNCYLSSHFEMDCYGFLRIMLFIKFVLRMVSGNNQMAKQRQSTLRWCKDVAWCPHYLHLEMSLKISEMLCVYCMAPG